MTRDTTETAEPSARKMGEIDHTHPHRDTTFGSIFGRGPTVAADGGERASGSRSSSERSSDGGSPATTQDGTSMAEVSHESPTGTDPSAVFDRGSSASDVHGGVANDE